MSDRPASSMERVKAALAAAGSKCHVMTLPDSTRSAADAAKAIGCSVAQIAKSIVFRAPQSDSVVLVIASGTNRVDEKKVEAVLGEAVEKANPEFIRERTGFAIGGVAPVGHTGPVRILMDEDLWKYDVIWAAAGTPHAVFKSTADELLACTSAGRCRVC